jgi:hypothetical protein
LCHSVHHGYNQLTSWQRLAVPVALDTVMLDMLDGLLFHGQPTRSTRRSGRVPPGPAMHCRRTACFTWVPPKSAL